MYIVQCVMYHLYYALLFINLIFYDQSVLYYNCLQDLFVFIHTMNSKVLDNGRMAMVLFVLMTKRSGTNGYVIKGDNDRRKQYQMRINENNDEGDNEIMIIEIIIILMI